MNDDGFTEPFDLSDIFVSGLARLEDLGDGNCRLAFYVQRKSRSEVEKVVNVHLVMSRPAVAQVVSSVCIEFNRKQPAEMSDEGPTLQ